MKWEHHCREDWMFARRDELTFSDIKSLIPVTATGRSRKITEEDYLKVYGSIFACVDVDSCASYGAAARGHIMEPHAVDFWNRAMLGKSNGPIYHWDDIVIRSPCPGCDGSIGFSPDALDVSIETAVSEEDRRICSVFSWDLNISPFEMVEIKSYDTGHHLACAATPKDKLQERWQVAMGMLVCPTIQIGSVLFFDPRCEEGNFCHQYLRNDLQDEIDMLTEAAVGYYDWLHKFDGGNNLSATPLGAQATYGLPSEEVIHMEYLKSKENTLDPL